ncbi:EAL domain-containing protein [Rhodoferax sp.]|uniref:EAL domain-containing protein n=1 Tax=Rhodoferax sp. TaxID=50421 RepID=UPI00374DA2AD
MAVNVSAMEFHSKGFLDGLQSILAETGLPPNLLELELTESGLLQDSEPTIRLLQTLKNLGVHISIDDFGTGYSSLSYLRHFPIDTIKIDQSFVRHIHDDNGESKLVIAIIAMGKSLNLQVIAEGIETAAQLDYLQSQGCVQGQGYFFSRPVHAKAFAEGKWAPYRLD